MFNFLTYNKFKTKRWNKLSAERRLRAFQNMEKIVARRIGREVYLIAPKAWKDGTRGLCVYDKKIIYINSDYFAKDNLQFMGLATLFHEQRHAEQHFVVKTKKKISKISKAYKWQQNMKNYIVYEGNEKYSYYSMQEIERDANRYAIEKLNAFGFRWRYRNDEVYYKSVRQKEKEYDMVRENARKELGIFYRLKLFIRRKREEKKNR